MISKTNVPPAKRKKPRGEQLLDRIDKNPNDREAWNSWRVDRQPRWEKRKSPPGERRGSIIWNCDLFVGPPGQGTGSVGGSFRCPPMSLAFPPSHRDGSIPPVGWG